jgi:glycosyltransferase involved in cell wall biosynthesis
MFLSYDNNASFKLYLNVAENEIQTTINLTMRQKYRTLSIIIPTYNEADTLNKIIKKVSGAKSLNLRKEIIIVDDGSTDNTSEILNRLKNKNIKIITLEKNSGKGSAIRAGFLKVKGDIVLIQDADLEYDPSEYELLLQPIISGVADVVYGSRFVSNHPHRVLYFWHTIGNSFLTAFSNMLTNLNLTDMETGYKVFTKAVINEISPQLMARRFGIEPEITAKIAQLARNKGIRIYEVGISYFGRTYAEGKKINWKDGLKAIWYIIKYNLRN